MDLNEKLLVLDKIYKIYEDYTAEMEVACYRLCDSCCTCNVTLTSLEGQKIADFLKTNGREDLLEKLEKASRRKYFQPKITTNKLAELCVREEEIPEEPEHGQSACLFLEEGECLIYQVRPFECRSFFSEIECRRMGYAYLPQVYISVANLIKQYIEQLDIGGLSGNLIDIMLFYKNNQEKMDVLISNQRIQMPLIHPDHLPKIQPVLQKLREVFMKKNPDA